MVLIVINDYEISGQTANTHGTFSNHQSLTWHKQFRYKYKVQQRISI